MVDNKNTYEYYDRRISDIEKTVDVQTEILSSIHAICRGFLGRIEALEASSHNAKPELPSIADQFKGQTIFGGSIPDQGQ